MSYRIGVDIGGTFTDLVLQRIDGQVTRGKTLSTPEDFSDGVVNGLQDLAEREGLGLRELLGEVELIVHGTTVATNAVLTQSGARTGLITTRGFRDALEMRRGVKEHIYDNKFPPPPQLSVRRLRLPVSERTLYDGTVIQETAEEDVLEACDEFRRDGIEAVAICFLNAYANGSNEAVARKIIESQLEDIYVTTSHELLPRVGFYDRLSTAVLNSYTGPIVATYLQSLAGRLAETGFRGTLLVMLSSGGVASADLVVRQPAAAIRSGPAGAAIAGVFYAGLHNHEKAITLDMGGTSLDTAIIVDGQVAHVQIADFERYRVALPMVDLVSIGAGGGSVAWLDSGGLLHVGPQSAGANPGPASYGQGGTQPTVTDADLILGYISPSGLLGGRLPLDRAAAERAVRRHIADPLGMSVEEAAAAICEVVNVNMASAVREFLHERGYDPREFTLIAGGGAGPLHAAEIARELEVERVIVPLDSAVLSAIGLLQADLTHHFVETHFSLLEGLHANSLSTVYASMVARGRDVLESEGIPASDQIVEFSADMRYERQINEIEVAFPKEYVEAGNFDAIARVFHSRHEETYGYSLPDSPIEFVNARVTAIARTPGFTLPDKPVGGSTQPLGAREVRFADQVEAQTATLYGADTLARGARVSGPAIVEGTTSSVLLPAEFQLVVDSVGNYVISVGT